MQKAYEKEIAQFLSDGKSLGIAFTDRQIEQFLLYYEMLIEKNKVMNLTGIVELSEVMQKHFIDSLTICQSISLEKVEKLLDIGTGAGFPGIPLKIMFPHIQITLLDSLKKRLDFLEEVIEALHLTGIAVLHGRAEDYAREKEHREAYDLCVSRAVANLSTLSEYCLPYVKTNGCFISYKSGKAEEEILAAQKAMQILGGSLTETVYFTLPNSDIKRILVKIEKIRKTPLKYPRKAGLPSKEPIS